MYPVSEGYFRKIPVERKGTFDCPRNQYFSQITLTNRIYLFNSAQYLTASKTASSLAKGYDSDPPSLHPWQI